MIDGLVLIDDIDCCVDWCVDWLCWWMVLCWLMVCPWEDIFKLTASTAASKFCEWVQVEIYKYILVQTSLISMVFSSLCAHRNHFFRLYQQKKSCESKVIIAKGFLKVPNLHKLIKQKSTLLPVNLVLRTFGKLPIVSLRR